MRPLNSTRNGGFSLLELVATLVVLAMLISGAVLTFRRPLSRIRENEFRDKLIFIQNRCRDECRLSGVSGELEFRPSSIVWRHRGKEREFNLSKSARIDSYFSEIGEISFGNLILQVNFQGMSDCAAFQIVADSGKSYWLLIVGGTGESIEMETESEVRRFFRDLKAIK